MKINELLSKEITKKCIRVCLLLIIATLSLTVVSKIATDPKSYVSTIHSIDEKKAAVMGVTAAATATSTALATIPGDITNPIANKIMDMSSYLLIVVCALVLEKSLLTVMGFLSFKILIPISCLLLGIYVFGKYHILKKLALKFFAFALVIVFIIPFSMKISDMIYETDKTTIEQITEDINEDFVEKESKKEKPWIKKVLDDAKDSVSDVGEKAKQILNRFIDAIALFIIAYCVMPIIIILVVIWFVNFLFGLGVSLPKLKNKQIEQEKEIEI